MLAVNNILLGVAYVLDTILEVYFWIVLISCVLTWVSANPYNPIVRVLKAVTEPVFYRVRKLLPFVYAAGIDFSPVVVVLLIKFLQIGVVKTIRDYALGI